MKKIKVLLLTLALLFCSLIPNKTFVMANNMLGNTSIPIYRLYNAENGEHLYTSDENEKEVLYGQYGWGYEGVAWYAPLDGNPVYRLYNSQLCNHLYTTDLNEVQTLTSTDPTWSIDNNGQPLFYAGGDVLIYRVYNKELNGMHHLTTDLNEYNILPTYGWTQEGTSLNAVKLGEPIQTTYCEGDEAIWEDIKTSHSNFYKTDLYEKMKPNTYIFIWPNDDNKFDVSNSLNAYTDLKYMCYTPEDVENLMIEYSNTHPWWLYNKEAFDRDIAGDDLCTAVMWGTIYVELLCDYEFAGGGTGANREETYGVSYIYRYHPETDYKNRLGVVFYKGKVE